MRMLATLAVGVAVGLWLSVLLEGNVYGYYQVYYPSFKIEEFDGHTHLFVYYCVRTLLSPEELVNADGSIAPQLQCTGSSLFHL